MINGRRSRYYAKDKRKFERFLILFGITLYLLSIFLSFKQDEKLVQAVNEHEEILRRHRAIITSDLMEQIKYLDANVKRLESDFEYIKSLDEFPSFDAEVTWYTAGFESTGKTPEHPEYGITASGKIVQANHTIAADGRFPFGTKFLIDNIVYVVEDRGELVYDNKVDIFVEHLEDIPPGGRVIKKVYILEWGRG